MGAGTVRWCLAMLFAVLLIGCSGGKKEQSPAPVATDSVQVEPVLERTSVEVVVLEGRTH